MRRWPAPPDDRVYHGLAGDFVRATEPCTEADPLGLLVQFVVMFGNAVCRTAHFRVEATRHYCNENAVLVGQSSQGRKGTSADRVKEPFTAADHAWSQDRIKGGLSSGEGLISAVRDPVWAKQPVKERGKVVDYENVMLDEGVEDKRLLILETEFGGTLEALRREGNKLSALMRQAWDSGHLATLTKLPFRATNAHVSVIGHVTAEELLAKLSGIDAANGFANRFLWVAVRRSKLLPFGGSLTDLTAITERLAGALEFARSQGELRFTAGARAMWEGEYGRLTTPPPGVLGAVTSRAAPHVVRLAMVYALLDRTPLIAEDHLAAALELWGASARCAGYIFGDAIGDPDAERILAALRSTPGGLTRSQIREGVFQRNKPAARIRSALETLIRNHLVEEERDDSTGGAPAYRYHAAGNAINAINAISPPPTPDPVLVTAPYGVNRVNGVSRSPSGSGADRVREVIEL